MKNKILIASLSIAFIVLSTAFLYSFKSKPEQKRGKYATILVHDYDLYIFGVNSIPDTIRISASHDFRRTQSINDALNKLDSAGYEMVTAINDRSAFPSMIYFRLKQ